MTSADHPDNTTDPAPSPEFVVQMQHLSRAIDNVLVANITLRHSLASDHMPFSASLVEAMTRYGADSPVLALWLECRAVDALRCVWTGKRGT